MAKAKTPPAKKPGKQLSEKENLVRELKSLIPKLDEEGLAFLVKQAHVHLYNMQVDALNQTIIKDAKRKNSSASRTKKAPNTEEADFIDIKPGSSGYFISYNNEWISFTGKEITTMVKIVKGEGTKLEIRERLFNWLAQERSDILNTACIADKFDKKIVSLIGLLNDNFQLKQ